MSREITSSLSGSRVVVLGMVLSVRRQGGLCFIILQDGCGIIQITAHKDKTPSQIFDKLVELMPHSYIGVKGVVKAIEKAPRGVEVEVEDLYVFSEPKKLPPFEMFAKTLPSLDKRLEIRAVDLRRPQSQAIFKLKHQVLQSIRSFLVERNFIEINTPKIIGSATEGGAALFPLLYYDKEAFLAQSPQLYKEQLSSVFERVFEIGPVFRAEKFKTPRHLSEITSVDVEVAFADYGDVMNLLEEMIDYVIGNLMDKCSEELQLLEVKLEKTKTPFKRITYDEAYNVLKDLGVEVSWGEDFSTLALKRLGRINRGFYFITDWPTISKPFYIKPKDDNSEISESFDLMYGSLELSSGGSRVSSRDLLVKRLKQQGLNPKLFDYHLRIYDYGMPP
ncbi:aspartate--tRNA(Asn) ligase, partial [Candidatus Bathyarchaeota archaeon]|nr:aspartate--tRNA(Asn) ligase [Candidatus Bathyarchaeota archaeon]